MADQKNYNSDPDIISKQALLNWLNFSAEDSLPIKLLGQWIFARTKGKYTLVHNEDIETADL